MGWISTNLLTLNDIYIYIYNHMYPAILNGLRMGIYPHYTGISLRKMMINDHALDTLLSDKPICGSDFQSVDLHQEYGRAINTN